MIDRGASETHAGPPLLSSSKQTNPETPLLLLTSTGWYFDRGYRFKNIDSQSINTDANVGRLKKTTPMSTCSNPLVVEKPGYVYIYSSSESPVEMSYKKKIYTLLFWSYVEIRLETAAEDGNLVTGYERIWQLSHSMHNVPVSISKAGESSDYKSVIDDLDESLLHFHLDKLLEAVHTVDSRAVIHSYMAQSFTIILSEAMRLANKKIVAICSLVKDIPESLIALENEDNFERAYHAIRDKADVLRLTRWFDHIFSIESA